MANKTVFQKRHVKAADTHNAAGGVAYKKSTKAALAQFAATNTFNGTYYEDASQNLAQVKQLIEDVKHDPEFIAKLAIYSRSKAYLKDMPAYFVAVLNTLDTKLFRKVFPLVIDNGKMLRNYVQIARSGEAGRKINLSSSAARKAINEWFASHSSESIFKAIIGNDPTLGDILRMARPKPNNKEKAALYAYIRGTNYDSKSRAFITLDKDGNVMYKNYFRYLPEIVQEYENFKKTHEGEIPNVDFRMLDSILNEDERKALWRAQAENGGWMMTRMNLNNFAKYGIFSDKRLTKKVAKRLANPELIKKARAYPYQLLTAYQTISSNPAIPMEIKEALQDAMEIAIDNVPEYDGKIYVAVDTSGSMCNPITGNRGYGAATVTRCVDVAALFASAILRRNKDATVIPFDTRIHRVQLNPRDSVMTNVQKLNRGGGGTDCACVLRHLNQTSAKGDLVVYVSDCESWVDSPYHSYYNRNGTGMMNEWTTFKARNKKAKLVCIDLTPRTNSQVTEHKDILQVGGFGENVFDIIGSFLEYGNEADHWLSEIEKIEL